MLVSKIRAMTATAELKFDMEAPAFGRAGFAPVGTRAGKALKSVNIYGNSLDELLAGGLARLTRL